MKLVYHLEDDIQILQVTRWLVEIEFPEQVSLRTFRTLADLRSACANERPDLICADLNVLDSSPIAVSKFLESETPADLPVLICSGDTSAMQRLFSGNPRFTLYCKSEGPEAFLSRFAQSLGAKRQGT